MRMILIIIPFICITIISCSTTRPPLETEKPSESDCLPVSFKRNNYFANSGIVVEINADKDLFKYEQFGPLKGLEYQKDLERLAFTSGGRRQSAPAQRLTDFVEGRLSTNLNSCSYQPGLNAAPLHSLLPKAIGGRLRQGFKVFGHKMKGYFTEEAKHKQLAGFCND